MAQRRRRSAELCHDKPGQHPGLNGDPASDEAAKRSCSSSASPQDAVGCRRQTAITTITVREAQEESDLHGHFCAVQRVHVTLSRVPTPDEQAALAASSCGLLRSHTGTSKLGRHVGAAAPEARERTLRFAGLAVLCALALGLFLLLRTPRTSRPRRAKDRRPRGPARRRHRQANRCCSFGRGREAKGYQLYKVTDPEANRLLSRAPRPVNGHKRIQEGLEQTSRQPGADHAPSIAAGAPDDEGRVALGRGLRRNDELTTRSWTSKPKGACYRVTRPSARTALVRTRHAESHAI